MKLSMLALAALAAACASSREPKPLGVPTTAAVYAPNEPAIRVLTRARCAHESICGRIGPGKEFATEAACDMATDLDERSSVGIDACPFGVDQDQLERCVATVRRQMCRDPIRALEDVADCRRFEMCR